MNELNQKTSYTVLPDTCFEDRSYRFFFWMLVAGSFLIFFWGIWSVPLLSHNEGRRLVVLREMMTNSSWLIPTMNGKVYLDKPPLFYWCGAVFGFLAHGTPEWVLRLPSGLSAMCLVWMLFFGLREHIGRWAALFAVLILVTSPYFTMLARLAEIEMLLTFCVFSSVLFYFKYIKHGRRSALYGAYAMMGLAFLTKGPVALLFFLPPIAGFGLIERNRHALKGLVDWRGWLLFAIIAFPWFIYVDARLPGAPMIKVITNEASDKIAGKKYEPFYFYLIILTKNLLPWIFVLLWQPRVQFRKLSATAAGRYFGLAAVIPLILFSLFMFKRDKYILPMYPAAAVWLGMALAQGLEQVKQRRRSATVALTAFSTLLVAGVLVFYSMVQARLMSYRYAGIAPLAARLDIIREKAPVYFYQKETIQLVYFYGRPIPVITKAKLAKMLANGESLMLLAKDKYNPGATEKGLCLLERIEPFGETEKVMNVFAAGTLCRPLTPN